MDGQASYRDSEGNETQANVGEAIMLFARPDIHYSEHNLNQTDPLIRMQLWLDTHPTCNNPTVQKITRASHAHQLLASPDGQDGSLQVRQQIRVHYIALEKGERLDFSLCSQSAYLQSICGSFLTISTAGNTCNLNGGDGAFICEETTLTLVASSSTRVPLIGLPC